jgi:hypothetical protein
MRNYGEWKTDKEFHSLLLSLNEEASADEFVRGLCFASHVANQEALLASDIYSAALYKKTRELYLLHDIDPSCLGHSEGGARERIARRERYKANGYQGEW